MSSTTATGHRGHAGGSAVERAAGAWGKQLPEWVMVLAEACDRDTQSAAAVAIGYSSTVVNRVLSNSYNGDCGRVEASVQGAFMGVSVVCPVLGTLALNRCIDEQTKPFAAISPTRVALFQACRECENKRIER